MEAACSGGSQGQCEFNSLMRRHLHAPGAFPRHDNRMLIIILKSQQKCGYFGICICPYEQDGKLKMNNTITFRKVCPSAVENMIDEFEEATVTR
eukprot:4110190-Ditylum_brightwellii.AAC.1